MLKNHRMGTAILTGLALVASGQALAQHSDIEVGVEGSTLTIENGELMSNGSMLFESEFGELANPYESDEPGFELDDGLFNEGEILAFELLGALQYWDGSSWVDFVVDAEQIVTTDALGDNGYVGAGGVTNGVGLIGAADDEGGVHDHIDFEIDNSLGSGMPMSGAYLIELALFGMSADMSTQLYGATDSFFIAFNLGMDEADFEMAVDALLAPTAVPVPAAAVLLFSGLASMFGFRRRRA